VVERVDPRARWSMAGEIEARNCGISALTRSTVEMMFAFGLPVEDDQHGRLAVGEAGVAQISRPPSVTSPTSERCTAAPLSIGDDQ